MASKVTAISDVIQLIQEVRKNASCVWNVKDVNYNNRFHVALCWKKIAKKMGRKDHVLRVKWKNLKDTFKKELKKYPGEDLASYQGKWIYFEHLYFLEDNNANYDSKDVDEFLGATSENDDEENHYEKDDDDKSSSSDDDTTTIKQEIEYLHDDDNSNIEVELPPRQPPIKKTKRKKESLNNTSKEISFVSVDSTRDITKEYDYDEMFLKSLTPYFSKLDPMRKLIVRGRFQDMLMSELAAQNSKK